MCNMHTSLCNESLTLKVGTIQIRQLLRLYPSSWLEAGSIHIPELRMNAKFECHPPTPVNLNEQIEFLLRHDQQSHRLHFLYSTRSQQPLTGSTKRPSSFGLPTSVTLSSCACLGGSPHYYTLVQGEQFFKSSFRLSEQQSFGRSLFRPDLHVIHSHPVFHHKYNWNAYEFSFVPNGPLSDEEIFYPFDFCAQQNKQFNNQDADSLDGDVSRLSEAGNNIEVLRANSFIDQKHESSAETSFHRRSASSIPRLNEIHGGSPSRLSGVTSASFLTPRENLSISSSKHRSLNDVKESASLPEQLNFQTQISDGEGNVSLKYTDSSSDDSLTILEEILHKSKLETSRVLSPEKVNRKQIKDAKNRKVLFAINVS